VIQSSGVEKRYILGPRWNGRPRIASRLRSTSGFTVSSSTRLITRSRGRVVRGTESRGGFRRTGFRRYWALFSDRASRASEIPGRGGTVDDAANILADSPLAGIRRYSAKWTPEFPARQDRVSRMVHGTNAPQADEWLSKCRSMKGVGWWPGTESNRRRQPFQGRLPTRPSGLELAQAVADQQLALEAF
jgi:hypothetical protein